MATTTSEKVFWLVNYINTHRYCPFHRISNAWEDAAYNTDQRPLIPRTFAHWKDHALKQWGVIIRYKRPDGYFIADMGSLNSNKLLKWTYETAITNATILQCQNISHRIQPENITCDFQKFNIAVDAINKNKLLKLIYAPYSNTEARQPDIVAPLWLKQYKQRWYLIGQNISWKTTYKYSAFALDERTKSLELLEQDSPIKPDEVPSVETYYRNVVGIFRPEPQKLETVRFITNTITANYIRQCPFYQPFTEQRTPDYSIFTITLQITHDLIEDLLSHTGSLTVLEPQHLVQEIEKLKKVDLKQEYLNTPPK